LLVVIWVGAALLAGGKARRVVAEVAALAGVIVLSGGVWMLRDLVLTGNPVFDYKVSLFGATIFPAPPSPVRDQVGWSIAHYFGDPSVLRRYVWPVFRRDFGLIGGLAAAAVPVSAAVWWLRARRADPRIVMLGVASIALALAYAI